jgi:hypothetical protein
MFTAVVVMLDVTMVIDKNFGLVPRVFISNGLSPNSRDFS